jgi:serine/threonine protein kinase
MPSAIGRGTLIADRYQLEVLVGQGGEAEVYRARDTRSTQLMALKIAKTEDPRQTQRAATRFQQSMTIQTESPFILRPVEYGEFDDVPFLVMPLLEAPSVAERLLQPDQLLGPVWIVTILIAIAYGLRDLHRAGQVHCDVKPENTLTTHDRHACLTDLETTLPIGKAIKANSPPFGTEDYLAPEQDGRGGRITPQTDVHAMGVTVEDLMGLRNADLSELAQRRGPRGLLIEAIWAALAEAPSDRGTPTALGKRVLAAGAPLWSGRRYDDCDPTKPVVACLGCGSVIEAWRQACESCAAPMGADPAVLLMTTGALAGRAFVVPQGLTVVGRHQLDPGLKELSRRHLTVTSDPTQLIVGDAGATNPATVANRPIDKPLRITDPIQFSIGGSHGVLLP